MKSVCIISGDNLHRAMYANNGWDLVSSLREADLVHFTGGADVSPSLYGQDVHPLTSSSGARDMKERALWLEARRLKLPMVGECRGAQFLNVMCGGQMYQHVDGHACGKDGHMMVDLRTGMLLPVTSTHHQMMWPSDSATILGVASESTVWEYMKDEGVRKYRPTRGEDVEVVYYANHNCLCFQGHPEYVDKDHLCQKYFFDLITEYSVCAD